MTTAFDRSSLRLPTRCPTCKGAVIQRMPSPSHGLFIWYHCLFCRNMWKFRTEDHRPNATGELVGEVFVVTKGRVKYKFGSIAVTAIPEDVLKKHLKSKTLQAELESQTLQRDIERLSRILKMAQAEEDRLWAIYQLDEGNARNSDAWLVAYNKTKDIAKEIEALLAERHHRTSGEYFFEGLPSGISKAKTDANGKFTLAIPRRGRYGVVARASRELSKEKEQETYSWVVWATLDGQASKRLVLSNDNTLGAGSPDSALD